MPKKVMVKSKPVVTRHEVKFQIERVETYRIVRTDLEIEEIDDDGDAPAIFGGDPIGIFEDYDLAVEVMNALAEIERGKKRDVEIRDIDGPSITSESFGNWRDI